MAFQYNIAHIFLLKREVIWEFLTDGQSNITSRFNHKSVPFKQFDLFFMNHKFDLFINVILSTMQPSNLCFCKPETAFVTHCLLLSVIAITYYPNIYKSKSAKEGWRIVSREYICPKSFILSNESRLEKSQLFFDISQAFATFTGRWYQGKTENFSY